MNSQDLKLPVDLLLYVYCSSVFFEQACQCFWGSAECKLGFRLKGVGYESAVLRWLQSLELPSSTKGMLIYQCMPKMVKFPHVLCVGNFRETETFLTVSYEGNGNFPFPFNFPKKTFRFPYISMQKLWGNLDISCRGVCSFPAINTIILQSTYPLCSCINSIPDPSKLHRPRATSTLT